MEKYICEECGADLRSVVSILGPEAWNFHQWIHKRERERKEIQRLRAGLVFLREGEYGCKMEAAAILNNAPIDLRTEPGEGVRVSTPMMISTIEKLRQNLAFMVAEVDRLGCEVEQLQHERDYWGFPLVPDKHSSSLEEDTGGTLSGRITMSELGKKRLGL